MYLLDGNWIKVSNECTKVQNPRRPRVRESLNACANAGKQEYLIAGKLDLISILAL